MPALTPRNIAIGAGAVVAVSFMFPRSAAKVAPMQNVFETQGVKNVADRYAAQGGTTTHLPGAATPLGNSDSTNPNQTHAKGMGTEAFANSHSDQKVGTPSQTEAQFQKTYAGDKKGK